MTSKKLFGELISILSCWKFEQIRWIINHENFQASFKTDESSSLDFSYPLKINLFEQLFAALIFCEEKQTIMISNIQSLSIIGFSWLGGVKINEGELIWCQYQSSLHLIEGFEQNTIYLDWISLWLFVLKTRLRVLEHILNQIDVCIFLLINQALVNMAIKEFEELWFHRISVIACNLRFMILVISLFEYPLLQLIILDEFEAICESLFHECFDSKAAVSFIGNLEVLWPIV